MVNVFGAAVRAKLPSGFTVTVTVVLALNVPEVPVIVTVAVPFFAVELAVNVTVLDEVTGFKLKTAVTPFGSPLAVSETFPENPLTGVTLTVLEALPTPCTSVTAAGAADRVKLGFPWAMVRFKFVLLVREPDVPVMVSADVLDAAVGLTVKVSVLAVVAGFGLNEAVTPSGRFDTERPTFP